MYILKFIQCIYLTLYPDVYVIYILNVHSDVYATYTLNRSADVYAVYKLNVYTDVYATYLLNICIIYTGKAISMHTKFLLSIQKIDQLALMLSVTKTT